MVIICLCYLQKTGITASDLGRIRRVDLDQIIFPGSRNVKTVLGQDPEFFLACKMKQ